MILSERGASLCEELLIFDESEVEVFLEHKLLVRADFSDLAMIEDDDTIGVADRGDRHACVAPTRGRTDGRQLAGRPIAELRDAAQGSSGWGSPGDGMAAQERASSPILAASMPAVRFWSSRVSAVKLRLGRDGALRMHSSAFVLAGLPTTTTLQSRDATSSRTAPWALKMPAFAASRSFRSIPGPSRDPQGDKT